ncbi:hypothetical protein P0D69_19395 [Paraburkholderia sediminicola]|uniref:hypothetical protein n=1 Tax=Paraburkholderia sediminicola TaxID=458836 RepID=UPI0038BC0414
MAFPKVALGRRRECNQRLGGGFLDDAPVVFDVEHRIDGTHDPGSLRVEQGVVRFR